MSFPGTHLRSCLYLRLASLHSASLDLSLGCHELPRHSLEELLELALPQHLKIVAQVLDLQTSRQPHTRPCSFKSSIDSHPQQA